MTAERVEFGFAVDEHAMWCAKRVAVQQWMLCGRRKSWMPPVQQPFVPPNLCPDCRKVIEAGVFTEVPDVQAEGTCPVCVGRAPVDSDGLIAAHRQWSWSDGRLVVTDRPCPGEGEPPEYES